MKKMSVSNVTYNYWVLLKSSDDAFGQTMWNIYDETQQHHWMPEGSKKPSLTQ